MSNSDGERCDEVRYRLTVIRGVPFPPKFDPLAVEELLNTFETRESDVFVCTFTRSGTTLTQHIINLLLNKGNDPIQSRVYIVPWLEAVASGGICAHKEGGGWSINLLNEAPNPRFFKTHAFIRNMPRGSPKDLVVSLHHHAKDKPSFEFAGTFDDTFEFFMKGTCENGYWFTHVLEWWKAHQQDPNRILFLHYEDLVKQKRDAIKRISSFIKVSLTAEELENVIEKSSIEQMKKDPTAMGTIGVDHIRNGVVGRWRDTFTVRQNERFNSVYAEEMKGSGLVFDFGEGLSM